MQRCDLVACVVCAVPVEMKAVIEVFSRRSKREVVPKQSRQCGEYRELVLQNCRGEQVRVVLSWLPRYGPVETALHFQRVLQEFHPHFAGMSGICAADRRKTFLGDLAARGNSPE